MKPRNTFSEIFTRNGGWLLLNTRRRVEDSVFNNYQVGRYQGLNSIVVLGTLAGADQYTPLNKAIEMFDEQVSLREVRDYA